MKASCRRRDPYRRQPFSAKFLPLELLASALDCLSVTAEKEGNGGEFTAWVAGHRNPDGRAEMADLGSDYDAVVSVWGR